jgi:hypothetical protein
MSEYEEGIKKDWVPLSGGISTDASILLQIEFDFYSVLFFNISL